MNHNWIVHRLFYTERAYGFTVDKNGYAYFTTGFHKSVYRIQPCRLETLFHVNGDLCGIVWSASNNALYICDKKKKRILSYSIDSETVSTVTGKKFDKGIKDGKLADACLQSPRGAAIDKNGDIYFTDADSIRKINISEGTVVTIAGSEQAGHKDGESTQALFNGPDGIAVSSDGTIYVADAENHCIRRIKDGIVSTIAGVPGKPGRQDGPSNQATLYYPRVVDIGFSLLVGGASGLRVVDLHNQFVSTARLPGENYLEGARSINCMCRISVDEFVAGGNMTIFRLINTWKWKRWLWIAHLKENPSDCILAALPRDIIKHMAKLVNELAFATQFF